MRFNSVMSNEGKSKAQIVLPTIDPALYRYDDYITALVWSTHTQQNKPDFTLRQVGKPLPLTPTSLNNNSQAPS